MIAILQLPGAKRTRLSVAGFGSNLSSPAEKPFSRRVLARRGLQFLVSARGHRLYVPFCAPVSAVENPVPNSTRQDANRERGSSHRRRVIHVLPAFDRGALQRIDAVRIALHNNRRG